MRAIRTKLVQVGGIPSSYGARGIATVIELTIAFENPPSGERKILLDVDALRELSDRAQGRKTRPFSSSTVAAGVKTGASTKWIVRRWLGRR